ncbi:hypothetical protein MNBD_ALPHA06-1967 [hydrothermal vent metagenome]|uniref:MobA-like NTP transferase domain-containing protein n=1 Tax=hydrothermal vent metagenome TaxID=652676 RepID=A0A3B0SJU0_9ZZZZ
MNNMPQQIGLVLAGGKSRRMGRNKADLRLQGQSFLDVARDTLSAAGCQQVLVSGPNGIPDRYADAGPLAGLDAAIAGLANEVLLLVIPVDMPKLQPDLLAELAGKIGQKPGLYFERHPMPFCLRVCDDLRHNLQATLGKPDADRSLFCLFRQMQFAAMPVDATNSEQFLNCNTSDEFAALEHTK